MAEITIYDFMIHDTAPRSKFQQDLESFCMEYQFYKCKVDEDGELIMCDINPYRSIEFIEGCQKRLTWNDLQTRYNAGEL
jgi:hypothetical protein